MNRRDFLKQVTAWSAGAAMVPLFKLERAMAQPPQDGPLLAVGTGQEHAAVVQRVIDALGGMKTFVKRGDKVVVKPNIGWDRTPEQAANTNPVVVAVLVRMALDQGAAQVMVFDRTCNESRRCYANSGIRDAVEAIGDRRVSIPFIDNRRFVPVDIENAQAVQRWDFYRDALDADCYINVPIAKHHGLTRLTLGLKNIMGIIGGKRGELHQQIAPKLADLNTVVRPRLTVIDATRILLRHGPQGGRLEDVEVRDTIIASTDPVAADAYATTLFGLKPEQIESTVVAHRRGLGEMELDKMRIVRV
jgi:uncharacterized protein (DUF362 family)